MYNATNALYVPEFWKQVLSRRHKLSMLTARSRKSSLNEFQAARPATANARRPYGTCWLLRLCRGTTRWWRLAERRCRRLTTSEIGMQQSIRRRLCTERQCLYFTSSGTSSQWRATCINCNRSWSNFLVSLTRRAATFQLPGCQVSVITQLQCLQGILYRNEVLLLRYFTALLSMHKSSFITDFINFTSISAQTGMVWACIAYRHLLCFCKAHRHNFS